MLIFLLDTSMSLAVSDSPEDPPENDLEARFNRIVDEYGRFLDGAIARVYPRGLGIQFDDIRQEACLRLWRALQNGREIQDLPSYLYKIAATVSIDALRRVKAKREEQLSVIENEEEGPWQAEPATSPEQSPDRQANDQEIARKVAEAVTSLSEERQWVVKLYVQGFTNQEIADLLGWSEPKTRNILYRGLKELRSRLRVLGIECEF